MQRKKTFDSFKRCKVAILSVLMSLCMTAAFAQSGAVKGKVLDELGEPIIGANIVEKGTTNGTITDMDGNYTLTVNDLKKAILQASFIGYNTAEESVKGRKTVEFKLAPSVVNLGEVVAIGYGTQTRREITGSVANISEENFNKGVNRDASDLLQGKVAGLQITSGSGDVTRSSQIRLRGTSTLQNDQGPMIVIDGVPGGDMSTVSPSDIESISVLKDASSSAIYGSRAAGGVILITTKRGSGSKTQVNYDGYVTMDKVANKPDMLNAAEWREVNKELGNDISVYDKYNADTDWFGALLRTGVSQNHSLSLSGGGSKNNYRASYTYLDRKGIARDNWMKRHSFRFQFQQRAINDRLRIGLTGAATLTDMQATFADYFIAAYNNPPVVPIYNEDGSYYTGNDNAYNQGNMVKAQDENYKLSKNNYFYGQGDIQFEIIDGLNVKANLYKSRFSSDYSQWESPDNALGGGSGNSLGDSGNGYAKRRNFLWDRELMEWTADYNKSFGAEEKHKLNALLGYSWETNGYQSQESLATQFSVASMGANSIQAGNDLKIGNVTSSKNEYKLISFFARAHYSYDERYMVTATIRRDGSSKFGANHKWGWFPSVSAAWGISQEAFMQDVDWLSDLKLRVGYGVTGNQDGLKPYKSLELYQPYGTYYENGATSTSFRITQNPNPDLKWESTAMFNIGLDFQLFNGRLGGTVEYYNKKTTDMLYDYAVPTPTYVYKKIAANVGDMSNKGIEVMLNLDVIRNKTFNWNTSINLSRNKNEITKLSNDLYSTSRVYVGDPWIRGASGVTSHVVEEGYPVGQFFMLKCNGIDENGKFIMEDVNGDGQISDDDRTYVGDAQPDLTFGWNNTFTWKNWDASFFLRGSIGGKLLNNPRAAYGNNTYVAGSNAMKGDDLLTLRENSRVCSYYLESASFARLDNMSIGYTFNTKKVDWLDKARIYVAAQNLFVITSYSGLDPEVELFRGEASDTDAGLSPGIEPRNYMPKARSFTFGVNLTF
ncbi:SusC/RagA family TonB-linked outer membrane protein [Parabacteroides distasonis]|uniref:SusC/RagA family TonB-linked outer membrane protein n=2 Tax=Parabacteroides distasonis TaxID=823 RepID=UPI00189C8D4C|nr:TonB-dependent receptor [Parabacteroides distasonis]MDB9150886.1 TonB-dependent receptor [Parabacteroides distasonis]MDB9156892.1 TonB-dependent receptor [Parabacteroides distasonis]MDB9163808.1 TonB-dependent receptor [Parabacteroides distasonis]MDB9167950.1 TonB-dependent receptor [Parabacteroides distasonis]